MKIRRITLSIHEYELLKRIVEVFGDLRPTDSAVMNGDYDLLWQAIVNDSEDAEESAS